MRRGIQVRSFGSEMPAASWDSEYLLVVGVSGDFAGVEACNVDAFEGWVGTDDLIAFARGGCDRVDQDFFWRRLLVILLEKIGFT